MTTTRMAFRFGWPVEAFVVTGFGATDDFGYAAVEGRIAPNDIHATMLHLLTLDFKMLPHPFEGRDECLVGVNKARVMDKIIGRGGRTCGLTTVVELR